MCGSCNEAPEVERRASARLPEITVNGKLYMVPHCYGWTTAGWQRCSVLWDVCTIKFHVCSCLLWIVFRSTLWPTPLCAFGPNSAHWINVQCADGNLVISAAEGKDVFIEGGDGVQVDLLAIEPAIQAELKASVDSATLLAEERERKSEYVRQHTSDSPDISSSTYL